MKICLLSYNDWGGSNYLLAKGINELTEHSAKSITEVAHPFDYDTDMVVSDYASAGRIDELFEFVKACDFFCVAQQIPPSLEATVLSRLRTGNFFFRFSGSDIRTSSDGIFQRQLKKWFWNCTAYDITTTRCLIRSIHHNTHILDTDRWTPKQRENSPEVVIYHSPTNNELKGTAHILAAVEKLQARNKNVRLFHTGCKPSGEGGVPWRQTMEDKSRCDIFIDSVCNDAHGQNAIEAMCFGIPVVNCLGDYYMALYPDIPIINACEESIYDVLKDLVADKNKRQRIGDLTRKYCVEMFSVKTRVKMWVNLIEFIVETGDDPWH